MKSKRSVAYVIPMAIGLLLLFSPSVSAMFDWGDEGGGGNTGFSGDDYSPISTDFLTGLALGDHHTQYPNAVTSNQYPGAILSSAVAIKQIRDQDHLYSDFSGTTYQYSISTEEFNDTTVNTTTYPKQLLPPIPNSTINNVYVVAVMGPKYSYVTGEEFSLSLYALVPLAAVHYNSSWNYTNIVSAGGGLYYVYYDSPHFSISSSYMAEYRWDVSRFLNWTPSILRTSYLLVALNSFQPLSNGVGGEQLSVDYLGLSYNWTYGIHARFTVPVDDFSGQFTLSMGGAMSVLGLMGLIATPAACIWVARQGMMDKGRVVLVAAIVMALSYALLIG